MATPRKRFFRVADRVLREPWENDVLAAAVRLMAAMNTRWRRDGLDGAAAGSITLGPSEQMLVTGKRRADAARRVLGRLADVCGMSVHYRGDIAWIEWPNFPEFQQLASRDRPESAPSVLRTPNTKKNPDCEDRAKPAGEGEEPAEPEQLVDELVAAMQGVPDRLSPEERQAFGRWLHKHYPPLWSHRLRLERQCLAHYRQHPDRAARVRSWLAAVEGYAKRAWEQERAQRGLWPQPVRRGSRS